MLVVHPAIIVLLVFGAIFEIWVFFALVYAILHKRAERPYWSRVKDALKMRLR